MGPKKRHVFCPASASAQQSTCQADSTPPSKTMCNNNEQKFVDNVDAGKKHCQSCAASDADKTKWLQSSTSCVACLGPDAAGCSGTDVCSLKSPNTCVVVGSSDGTCAAIDAAKSKWLQSSPSCVACIIPASPDDAGCFVTGCTGKVCGQTIGQNDAE